MTAKIADFANFEDGDFRYAEILKWAVSGTGGGLPRESAEPFAVWLDDAWNDYDDGEGTQTNEDVLKGALDFWTGRT